MFNIGALIYFNLSLFFTVLLLSFLFKPPKIKTIFYINNEFVYFILKLILPVLFSIVNTDFVHSLLNIRKLHINSIKTMGEGRQIYGINASMLVSFASRLMSFGALIRWMMTRLVSFGTIMMSNGALIRWRQKQGNNREL